MISKFDFNPLSHAQIQLTESSLFYSVSNKEFEFDGQK